MANHQQANYYDNQPEFGEALESRVGRIVSFGKKIKAAHEKASGTPMTSALDVGCAAGAVLEALGPFDYKAGVDVSDVLLARAAERGIDAKNCDIDNNPLPFEDETFDLVIATDVIEHVLRTDHLINEINRVLKPGGLFFAGIPNINQPVSLAMLALDLTPMYASRYRCPHYRDFTARIFKKILLKHGFRIDRMEGSFIYPFENNKLSILLASAIKRLGAQILYAAVKEKRLAVEEGFEDNMPALLKWLDRGEGAH